MPHANNLTVGRSRLLFNRFVDGTRAGPGHRYMGNTPGFSLSQSEENLDHFSSDGGVNVKDDSMSLSQDTSGSMICDDIAAENLALWFLGSAANVTQAAATAVVETFVAGPGSILVLGKSVATPGGAGMIANVIVGGPQAVGSILIPTQPVAADTVVIGGQTITWRAAAPGANEVLIGATAALSAANLLAYITANPTPTKVNATLAGTTLSLTSRLPGTSGNAVTLSKTGTGGLTVSGATLSGGANITASGNYTVDTNRGIVEFDEQATGIAAGTTIGIQYDTVAQSFQQIISGNKPIYGELYCEAHNPKGKNRDCILPYIKLAPDGEFDLKGQSWQQMTFTIEVLQRDSLTPRVIWKDTVAP